MKHAGTRVEDAEYDLFQRTAASIGTTPSDALRIFIYSFNDYHIQYFTSTFYLFGNIYEYLGRQ